MRAQWKEKLFHGRWLNALRRRRPFVHRPLESEQHIRLISGARRGSKGEIELQIVHLHISDAPEFCTLSYNWGQAQELVPIICNKALLYVSENLAHGIIQLLSQDAETLGGVRYFWIDQVCINQIDPLEKSRQVQLMGSIYTRAVKTIIWLGDFDDKVDASNIDFIHDLNRIKENDDKYLSLLDEAFGVLPINDDELIELDLPLGTDPRWKLLAHFLDRPWFRRAWVIQETALSQSEIVVLCGNKLIHGDTLRGISGWTARRRVGDRCIYDLSFGSMRAAFSFRGIGLSHVREKWSLQALLTSSRHSEATDPRDRIFALLGLITYDFSQNPWRHALIPDYEKPMNQVFREATRFGIEQSKALGMLDLGGLKDDDNDACKSAHAGLSSWTPRLDIPYHDHGLKRFPGIGFYFLENDDNILNAYNSMIPSADEMEPVQIRDHEDPAVLSIRGVYADTIVGCTRHYAHWEYDEFETHPMAKLWEQAMEWMNIDHTCSIDQENRLASALLTMTCPWQLRKNPDGKFMYYLRETEVHELKDFFYLLSKLYRDQRRRTPIPDDVLERYNERGWGGRVDDTWNFYGGLKYFITEKGYLGIGSAHLRMGDRLYDFFGGDQMYILRRCDGEYHYIGGAHVHEYASKEAIKEFKEGKRKDEWLDIR